MGRMLIFCRSYEEVIKLYQYFKTSLGAHFVEPPGSPDYVKYRVVDIALSRKKLYNNSRVHLHFVL